MFKNVHHNTRAKIYKHKHCTQGNYQRYRKMRGAVSCDSSYSTVEKQLNNTKELLLKLWGWKWLGPVLLAVTVGCLLFWRWLDWMFCHMDAYFMPMFVALNRILVENKIEAWIGAGAQLGLAREGRLLPWDYDLDFYCMQSEIAKLLTGEIRSEFAKIGLPNFYGRSDFIWDKWGF